jgi:flagellar protein FlaG
MIGWMMEDKMLINSMESASAITINSNAKVNTEKITGQSEKDKLIKTDANHIQLNINVTKENLTRAVEKINENYMAENNKLEYDYHEETGQYVVKVIDKGTNEIINQIPSQKLLDYAEGLVEYLGINIDKTV